MTSASEKNVLVVDSDDGESGWQKRIAGWLSDEFKVFTARNYNEALDCLLNQASPFHLVVSEVSLDEIDFNNGDGFALANRINELGVDTKTIILDGHASIARSRTALKGPIPNAFDYWPKYPEDGSDFDSKKFFLLCKNTAEEVENTRKQNLIDIFVVMPFALEYDPIYGYIQEVAQSMNKVCKRADRL